MQVTRLASESIRHDFWQVKVSQSALLKAPGSCCLVLYCHATLAGRLRGYLCQGEMAANDLMMSDNMGFLEKEHCDIGLSTR
jgi:hypothetical protein